MASQDYMTSFLEGVVKRLLKDAEWHECQQRGALAENLLNKAIRLEQQLAKDKIEDVWKRYWGFD